MDGQIRLGQRRPFTARLAGLPVAGFDRLSPGTAQMRCGST